MWGSKLYITEVAQALGVYAGLFLAPQMVGEALKGGRLIAEVMLLLTMRPTNYAVCTNMSLKVLWLR